MRAILISLWFGLFLGCSSGTDSIEPSLDAQNGPSGKVVILSSRDEKFMHGLLAMVEAEHPDLEIVVDYGKDAGYLDRLRVERDAPIADLYIAKASGPLESAAKDGLFEALPEELTTQVPQRFRGGDNLWTGLSARARILVRRKGLTDPPSSLSDLTQPTWSGRVARTVATNSSFVGGVTSYLADHGEASTRTWLKGLQNNSAGNVHPKHTPAVAAVAGGQADVALVNHYYFYRNVLGKDASMQGTLAEAEKKLADAPIEVVFPDENGKGVAWNVSGAGLVKGGPNPEGAKAVLRILLSKAGQQAYAFTNREYPVVDGLPSPPGVEPAASFKWSNTSLADLASHQTAAVGLIQELGLD